MKTLQFKTNLACGNCVAKVSPLLNENLDIERWHVDLNDADRTLTVEGDDANPQDVVEAVEKAGFTAQPV